MPTPNVDAIVNWNKTNPAAPTGSKNTPFQTDSGFPIESRTANYEAVYRVVYAQPGAPLFSTTVWLIAFDVAVTFPANFGAIASSSGAQAAFSANPSGGTFTYTFKKNGSTTIGTLAITTGGVVTFATTGGLAQSFAPGDILQVAIGSTDATLADVTIILPGYRT